MISVCIPYRKADEQRDRIFSWVLRRWIALHPTFEFVIGTDRQEPFSRSAARNDAVRQANGDTLIIADADTITEPANINDALQLLQEGAPWVVGSGNYYSLDEQFTDSLLKAAPTTSVVEVGQPTYHWVMKNRSIAGMLFIRRDDFVGYDERFIDWGWEDNAFQVQMDRKVGPFVRSSGPLYHLHHDPGLKFEQPHIKHNEELYNQIRRAA